MIPTVKITPEGMDAPSREEVTAGLWNMFRQAFGENLTIDDRTPQGQLVTSLTAILRDRDDQLIELGNNFDPRYAVGKFQEALGAVYFLERGEPKPSVVQLEFMGSDGAPVPIGTKSLDDNGHEWVTTQAGAVDASGTVLLWAECTEVGPITASPGTINQLVDAPANIDRVENLGPAAPGSLEESRVDYELRRAESVAANGKNTNYNVLGAVFSLPGVIDCYVIDNPTDSTVNVGVTNYPMPRHSLLVSVVGGDDMEIAEQVLIKGGTGCTFVGNTHVVYHDTSLGYQTPPEYDIYFERPTTVQVYFRLVVADMGAVTINAQNEARQSIVRQSQSGENKFRINSRIIAQNYVCEIGRSLGVVNIDISTDGTTWQKSIQFGVDQFPVVNVNDITITDTL